MNIYSILPLIAIFANFITCFFVLYINPKNNLNRFFGFFSFSLGIWSLCNYFTFNAISVSEAFFWNNIATIGTVLTSVSLFHFVLIFSKNKLAFNKIFLSLIYLSGFFLIFIEYTTTLITTTMYRAYWGFTCNIGPLYVLLSIYVLILIISSLFILYLYNKKTSTKELKKQTVLLFIAITIPFIGGLTTETVFPILNFEVIPFTSSLTTITAIIICFSIFKYSFIRSKSYSIQKKITISFLVIIVSLTFVFSVVNFYYQDEHLKNQADYEIELMQDKFNVVVEHEMQGLNVALEVIVQDKSLMNCYLEKNRTKLYDYGQPLFQKLKEKFEDTHFYFIETNGTCFVRLHNKDKYGDEITRFTYWAANATMNISYGLELGKTAFALRVVKPYYNGSQHIGFVELGKEIDHFFTHFKEDRSAEFAIILDKQYLDEDKWGSLREAQGLRNNWDDLEDKLIIMETVDEMSELDQPCVSCFISENVDKVIKGNYTPSLIQHEQKTYVCGGFPLIDAGNREVGTIFALIDISKSAMIAQNANLVNISLSIILLIFTIILAVLISRNISKPIENLSKSVKKIEAGNLDIQVEIKTNDEIGQLSSSFNEMVKSIRISSETLEQKIKDRTNDLQQKIKELEDFKKIIVGREMKMINLKTQINELKSKVNEEKGDDFH